MWITYSNLWWETFLILHHWCLRSSFHSMFFSTSIKDDSIYLYTIFCISHLKSAIFCLPFDLIVYKLEQIFSTNNFSLDYFPISFNFASSFLFLSCFLVWFLHENDDLCINSSLRCIFVGIVHFNHIFSLSNIVLPNLFTIIFSSYALWVLSFHSLSRFFLCRMSSLLSLLADMYIFIGITFLVYVVLIVILHFAKWVEGISLYSVRSICKMETFYKFRIWCCKTSHTCHSQWRL